MTDNREIDSIDRRSKWNRFVQADFTAARYKNDHHLSPTFAGWKRTVSCHRTYWARPNTGKSFTSRLTRWLWPPNAARKRTRYAPSCTSGPATAVADSSSRIRRFIGGITKSNRKKKDVRTRWACRFTILSYTYRKRTFSSLEYEKDMLWIMISKG